MAKWTAPGGVRDRTYEVPEGTPLRALCARVDYRMLNSRQAHKVRLGAFGQFLTGLSEREWSRFVQMDRDTAADRSKRDPAEVLRLQRQRERENPDQCFDLRRACLYAVQHLDGQDVETPKTAIDDPDVDSWLSAVGHDALVQLGTQIVTESGLIDRDRGEG